MRLDPAALPLRYVAADRGADDGRREVDLFRRHVVIRRRVAGSRMKLTMPVARYRGVAVSLAGEDDLVQILLVHADEGLTVPLYAAHDGDDVIAEWERWGREFALPLLAPDPAGGYRAVTRRMGEVLLGDPQPRRRRRSALRGRRPTALMRRKPGGPIAGRPVHREREIIARN